MPLAGAMLVGFDAGPPPIQRQARCGASGRWWVLCLGPASHCGGVMDTRAQPAYSPPGPRADPCPDLNYLEIGSSNTEPFNHYGPRRLQLNLAQR